MVTIPIVSLPIDLAIRATTGPAPVPVPPPIVAVINTILVSSSNSAPIFSSLFSASSFPTSGFPPAPSPLSPSRTLTATGDFSNTILSVFATAKATSLIPSSYMFLTALHPPPPTPTTFIRLLVTHVGMSSNCINFLVIYSFCYFLMNNPVSLYVGHSAKVNKLF